MASLLERLGLPNSDSSIGPVRRSSAPRSSPYARTRSPRGDADGKWKHDLFDDSLATRLGVLSTPQASSSNLIQRALQDAREPRKTSLSIKGAATTGNIVEVRGLAPGTSAEDVAAVFRQAGIITDAMAMNGNKGESPVIRVSYKDSESAAKAVAKFNNQSADGCVLTVSVVGQRDTSLVGRLGASADVIQKTGSVDILMSDGLDSKLRSDALVNEPGSHIMLSPPGASGHERSNSSIHSRGRDRGRRAMRGRRGRG